MEEEASRVAVSTFTLRPWQSARAPAHSGRDLLVSMSLLLSALWCRLESEMLARQQKRSRKVWRVSCLGEQQWQPLCHLQMFIPNDSVRLQMLYLTFLWLEGVCGALGGGH